MAFRNKNIGLVC